MNKSVDRIAAASAFFKALFVAVTLGIPAAACGAGVAMVTDLQGKATFTADGRPRDVNILAEIESGTQVQLAAGGSMVALYLETGDEYVFKGPASITFRPAQPEVTSGTRAEKRSASLGKGNAVRIKPVGVAQGAMVMRSFSSGSRIKLLNLYKTHTLEAQPEFRWQPLQQGVKYQIEITDDTGRTLQEAQVDAPSFKLPPGVALKEGVPYSWAVSARLPDGRKYSSSADFTLAPASVRAQAEALRPAQSAPLSTRVAYAAWLDQMELKDEARKYWQAASAERPDDPRLKSLAEQ